MKIGTDKKDLGSGNILNLEKDTYGVIGICGVVGNLVARVLMDNKQQVICTDLQDPADCPYLYTLNSYNTSIYFRDHPSAFFDASTYKRGYKFYGVIFVVTR